MVDFTFYYKFVCDSLAALFDMAGFNFIISLFVTA